MTDDIEDAIDRVTDEEPPEEPAEDPSSDDESGGSDDESMLGGLLPEMSGTGKPLDAYEDHPFRSLAGGAGGDVDADEIRAKGEKHVARGLDGLLGGIVDAGHPFVDLGIGFVLITISGGVGGSGDDEGYDGMALGGDSMDDTPGADKDEGPTT